MLGENNISNRPEVRRKHSDAVRGEKNPMYGKPGMRGVDNPSKRPEVRAKISEAQRGEKHKNWGKHHSEETLRRMRASARKGEDNPSKRSESRKKRSDALRGVMVGEKNPNWRGGTSFAPYCQKFNNEFKERVRAFWGYECGLCSKSQDENGRKLDVHHVNYRKDACCNEEVTPKFIPLCMTCHQHTLSKREEWEKKLSAIIEMRHGNKCYFRQGEQLTAYGVVV